MSLENFFENFFLTDDVKDKIQIDRLDTELNKTYNTHSQDILKITLNSWHYCSEPYMIFA